MTRLVVEFCGEQYRPDPDRAFVVGREGDLRVDDNPYLHRHFLRLEHADGLWWLVNTGSRLAATLSDPARGVQAWLGPSARLPLVLPEASVLFSAGPTTYEVGLVLEQAPYSAVPPAEPADGHTTLGALAFTPSQRLLMIALAEPLLRRDGTGVSAVPPSAEAAAAAARRARS